MASDAASAMALSASPGSLPALESPSSVLFSTLRKFAKKGMFPSFQMAEIDSLEICVRRYVLVLAALCLAGLSEDVRKVQEKYTLNHFIFTDFVLKFILIYIISVFSLNYNINIKISFTL